MGCGVNGWGEHRGAGQRPAGVDGWTGGRVDGWTGSPATHRSPHKNTPPLAILSGPHPETRRVPHENTPPDERAHVGFINTHRPRADPRTRRPDPQTAVGRESSSGLARRTAP